MLIVASDLGGGRAEEEAEDPVGRHLCLASRALQLVQVGGPPHEGGQKPAEPHPEDLVDGELAHELYDLPQGPVIEVHQNMFSSV